LLRNSCDSAGLAIGTTDSPNIVAAATKFAPVPWRTESKTVVEACKASAERLGVDQIPLYQIHWPDIIQPLKAFGREKSKDELYWEGIAECYTEGLVANVGVSNYGPETLLRVQDVLSKKGIPIVSNQINLSLMRYRSSEKTLDMCNDLGIKVLAYFPLANGLLAGKYSVDTPPAFPKSLTMKKYYEDAEPVLKIMRRLASKYDKTVAQVAINWVMMKGAIPIPGARSATMARDNFGSMGWALASEEVVELELAASKVGEFSNGGFELV
jgi:pyridoxine 4-dehydrogenase